MPRPFRILHVEDDDVHAELVRRTLMREVPAIELERVADGAEAQERLFGGHGHPQPDLILLDLKLPKVDGHEILAMVKGDERLRVIPVVVLTTSDQEADVQRAYAEHANSSSHSSIMAAKSAMERHYCRRPLHEIECARCELSRRETADIMARFN